MGKGYNNFMCKKPFHPASKDNIKRVWMAEQRSIDAKKKEDEMRLQYEKEQDLYNNRLLVAGSDSKDKLSLNFMYEAPPGVKREVKESETESEPLYKFEWQRNAPRESFAKNNMDIRDQPFGIQVRNVRCLKCHKWGHVNTDRECPLFNSTAIQSVPLVKSNEKDGSSNVNKLETVELIASMREEQGLTLKKSLFGNYGPISGDNTHHTMLTKTTKNAEAEFLETLSSKEKKRLLKKLQKLTGLQRSTSIDHKRDDKSEKNKHKSKSKKNRRKNSHSHRSESKSASGKHSSRSEKRNGKHDERSNHHHHHHHHRTDRERKRSRSRSIDSDRYRK
ncbi:Corepressor interacting with RBPJ 1 [Sarcoptes scabiei]|uniref:Corepressor interacting with RBPJ 1 n=1 Tax=Sarcoptes scabiei TaxID=52283 RepID=A0A132AEM3_SARSC|nr:Corepressor interacting with RBPJ 1 [Sarcoptes scabiei]KPM09441.1 corepressor interacting with RBPJ 1-like protein [Sarcoptes scabiei]